MYATHERDAEVLWSEDVIIGPNSLNTPSNFDAAYNFFCTLVNDTTNLYKYWQLENLVQIMFGAHAMFRVWFLLRSLKKKHWYFCPSTCSVCVNIIKAAPVQVSTVQVVICNMYEFPRGQAHVGQGDAKLCHLCWHSQKFCQSSCHTQLYEEGFKV